MPPRKTHEIYSIGSMSLAYATASLQDEKNRLITSALGALAFRVTYTKVGPSNNSHINHKTYHDTSRHRPRFFRQSRHAIKAHFKNRKKKKKKNYSTLIVLLGNTTRATRVCRPQDNEDSNGGTCDPHMRIRGLGKCSALTN